MNPDIRVTRDGPNPLRCSLEWIKEHPEEAARIRKEGEEEVAAEIAAENAAKAAKANRKK